MVVTLYVTVGAKPNMFTHKLKFILLSQLIGTLNTVHTAQLQGKTRMSSTRVLLASQFVSMPWLLTSIIIKYMDIISRVLARHTTSNLIITDGPYLLGHRVKKGEDSKYMQICS